MIVCTQSRTVVQCKNSNKKNVWIWTNHKDYKSFIYDGKIERYEDSVDFMTMITFVKLMIETITPIKY